MSARLDFGWPTSMVTSTHNCDQMLEWLLKSEELCGNSCQYSVRVSALSATLFNTHIVMHSHSHSIALHWAIVRAKQSEWVGQCGIEKRIWEQEGWQSTKICMLPCLGEYELAHSLAFEKEPPRKKYGSSWETWTRSGIESGLRSVTITSTGPWSSVTA